MEFLFLRNRRSTCKMLLLTRSIFKSRMEEKSYLLRERLQIALCFPQFPVIVCVYAKKKSSRLHNTSQGQCSQLFVYVPVAYIRISWRFLVERAVKSQMFFLLGFIISHGLGACPCESESLLQCWLRIILLYLIRIQRKITWRRTSHSTLCFFNKTTEDSLLSPHLTECIFCTTIV